MPSLPAGETVAVLITYSPTAPEVVTGELTWETSAGLATANLTATAVQTCPEVVAEGRSSPIAMWSASVGAVQQAQPLAVNLEGVNTTSPDPITGWAWTFVSTPALSTAAIQNPNAPSTFFPVDRVGTYELELRASTATSNANCPPGRVEVVVVDGDTPDRITVQLVWDTPADPNQSDAVGTDLNLHYLHPSGDWGTSWSAFNENFIAGYGADGVATYNLDDRDGQGPEIVNHYDPGPLPFAIGVHYFEDGPGYGTTTATVRIFRGNSNLHEVELSMEPGDFWHVGEFTPGADTFTADGTVTDGIP